jgi:hypothetical protein
MLKLGIILTAATVTVLVVEFFRARRRPFPAHGWLGLAALIFAEYLMFHGIEPAATYFTPFAWTSYILIADAAIFAITGHSRLREEPLGLFKMAALSIPLWLIFEAYNLRLANWAYAGLPESRIERWLGYGWSFATITPGIFMTAALVESFGWFKEDSRPIRFSRTTQTSFIALGAAMLIVPLVVPQHAAAYLFRPGLARFSRSSRADQPSSPFAFVPGRFRARESREAILVPGRGMGVRLAVGILEFLVSRGLGLHVPHRPAVEDLPDARSGLPGLPGVCVRMFRDVRQRRVAHQPEIRRREKIFGIAGCASRADTLVRCTARALPRARRFLRARRAPRSWKFPRTQKKPST